MEKKEASRRHNSLGPLLGIRSAFGNLFGRSSGFTLVELLTVVGIIGILVVAVLLVLDPFAQFQKANDTKRKGDLSQIQKALETYYQDNNSYPVSSNDYKIVNLAGKTVSWGEISTPQNQAFGPYMITMPKDPLLNRNYVYYTDSRKQKYWLYASLERPNDPQLCAQGNPCSSLSGNGVADNACGGTCNFGVSSPNTSP